MNARLEATLLDVALTEIAEPERLRRGRRYARQGAVIDLEVRPGVVRAAVQGSRPEPYEVSVRTNPAHGPRLAPGSADLVVDCTCPDWESPCKHGVAVLAELVERIRSDVSVLAVWRGSDAPRVEREVAPVDVRALDEFLGEVPDEPFVVPTLAPLPHIQLAWDEPWSVMLHDALRVLAGGR